MDDKFKEIFKNLSPKMKEEAAEKYTEKIERKEKSLYHFSLPGEYGVGEIWINEDKSFETMDSRYNDKDIKNLFTDFYKEFIEK